jgi:hypothetical protein
MSLKEIIGLEGVELGADGKVRLPGFQLLQNQEAEAVVQTETAHETHL